MDERRKAPKKVKAKSKWQEQYEKMAETQKKLKNMKDEAGKNKK